SSVISTTRGGEARRPRNTRKASGSSSTCAARITAAASTSQCCDRPAASRPMAASQKAISARFCATHKALLSSIYFPLLAAVTVVVALGEYHTGEAQARSVMVLKALLPLKLPGAPSSLPQSTWLATHRRVLQRQLGTSKARAYQYARSCGLKSGSCQTAHSFSGCPVVTATQSCDGGSTAAPVLATPS